MARESYVFRDGQVIRKEDAGPMIHDGPNIIRDNMGDTFNPVDGKHYDSKRGFEKAVRAAGCVITGNEGMSHVQDNRPRRTPVRHDLKMAFDRLRG